MRILRIFILFLGVISLLVATLITAYLISNLFKYHFVRIHGSNTGFIYFRVNSFIFGENYYYFFLISKESDFVIVNL